MTNEKILETIKSSARALAHGECEVGTERVWRVVLAAIHHGVPKRELLGVVKYMIKYGMHVRTRTTVLVAIPVLGAMLPEIKRHCSGLLRKGGDTWKFHAY